MVVVAMVMNRCDSLLLQKMRLVKLRTVLSAVRETSTSSTDKKRSSNIVTIRASDVAAVLGRNNFKKYDVVFDEMWKRHCPGTFVGQTKDEKALEAVENCSPEEKMLLAVAASYQAVDAVDARVQLAQAEKVIVASVTMSSTDKDTVLEHIKSKVYTAHGIRAESKTADLIEEKEGILLKVDTNFYNYPICKIEGIKYQISGKVDRIEQIGEDVVIIEIKNRMKRLFRMVPDYEFIQVQTYMQIVPLNVQRTKVIQQYQDETNTIIVERDDNLWKEEILPLLTQFCTDFHKSTTQSLD